MADKDHEALIEKLGIDDNETENSGVNVVSADYSVVEELSPWEQEVNGLELVNTVENTLKRHVVLPQHCTTAISLWIVGTYCMDAWRVWSKLLITSPQKRCGKSVLLETLEGMVHRPMLTSNITASALFRSIETWQPTLLIDEADTFTSDNDELNGIINCGHTKRTATVIRSEQVGKNFEPRKFNVWSPQVIAGIGKQRATLEDRSIQVSMIRKSPNERSFKLDIDYFEKQISLRRKLLRWASDNISTLRQINVNMPSTGNDRAEDNWRSLFVIAECIGGTWPEKVMQAFQDLTKIEDEDAGTMLLQDIRSIFFGDSDQNSAPCEHIHSEDMVNRLLHLDDRPWNEWKRGTPLTKNTVSKLLKPYGIKSMQIKIGGVNRHGYRKSSFEDAFSRYLPGISEHPPVQNATTLQPSPDAGFSGNENATYTKRENVNATLKRPYDTGCSEVAFPEGGKENEEDDRPLEPICSEII